MNGNVGFRYPPVSVSLDEEKMCMRAAEEHGEEPTLGVTSVFGDCLVLEEYEWSGGWW